LGLDFPHYLKKKLTAIENKVIKLVGDGDLIALVLFTRNNIQYFPTIIQ